MQEKLEFKMHKLIIISLIVIPLFLLQFCSTFDVIGFPSGTVGLGTSFAENVGKALTVENLSEDTFIVTHLKNDLSPGVKKILRRINNAEEQISHDNEGKDLVDDFFEIDIIFCTVIKELQHAVVRGRVPSGPNHYEEFRSYERALNERMNRIQFILTNYTINAYSHQDSLKGSKKFNDMCNEQLSNMQLLDQLLGNVKHAMGQYQTARNYLHGFRELLGANTTDVKEQLPNEVSEMYKQIVKVFKKTMINVTTDFWRCDPEDGYEESHRYHQSSKDHPFAELRPFSAYVLEADAHDQTFFKGTCGKNCKHLEKGHSCSNNRCFGVRRCSGTLHHCEGFSNLFLPQVGCFSKNGNSIARYISFVPKKKYLSCGNYTQTELIGFLPNNCAVCKCICEEGEKYYFDFGEVLADVQANKIVTGAKFVLKDRILSIEIQEGALGPNGTIDSSNVTWKGTTKSVPVEINWNSIREIILTNVILPHDHILTGLYFGEDTQQQSRIRIGLFGRHSPFDFRSGKVEPLLFEMDPQNLLRNYKDYSVAGKDVPTRASEKNLPINPNIAQTVKLSISSIEKDGGQTTIPFIDTQEVVPRVLSPISGYGLYLKGQKNYGGFLGIKLFTHNVTRYIVDDLWG